MRGSLSDRPLWQIHVGGLIGCLVLSACAYVTAIKPVTDAQIERHIQRTALINQRREANQLHQALQQMQYEEARLADERDASGIQLQSAGRINQRIAALTSLAGESGLSLQQIEPGRKHSEPLFDAVPIELQGQASYRDHLIFIRELHARFPDIAVSEIHVSGQPENRDAPAQFRLKLCWFTAREAMVRGE